MQVNTQHFYTFKPSTFKKELYKFFLPLLNIEICFGYKQTPEPPNQSFEVCKLPQEYHNLV